MGLEDFPTTGRLQQLKVLALNAFDYDVPSAISHFMLLPGYLAGYCLRVYVSVPSEGAWRSLTFVFHSLTHGYRLTMMRCGKNCDSFLIRAMSLM